MRYLWILVTVILFSSSAVLSAPCGPGASYLPWYGCLEQQRRAVTPRQIDTHSRFPQGLGAYRYSPIPTEILSCADSTTLRKKNLLLMVNGQYAVSDTKCGANEICLSPTEKKFEPFIMQDVAATLTGPACVAVEETTGCDSGIYRRVKIALKKASHELPVQCEDKTVCQSGKCVSEKSALCQDSDKTVVVSGKANWNSIIIPGQVTLATGEVRKDVCKDDSFLQEQYCDPETGAAEMQYVGCVGVDPSGKCVDTKCVFGTLVNDKDKDSIPDSFDNCPVNPNADQKDSDSDSVGDECDVDVVVMSVGNAHACALLKTGYLKCWGQNYKGQLGDGTNKYSSTPVLVGGLTNAVAVSLGTWYSCALLNTGQVQCWGENYRGQLGDGTTVNKSTPVLVKGLTDVVAVSASEDYTCAVLKTGDVQCWGYNNNGELGDGTFVDNPTPVLVVNLKGAVAVSLGYWHSCALLDTGQVQCWGFGGQGNLGNGTTVGKSTPVFVEDLADAVAVSAGNLHTCAVLKTGQVQCWGANDHGQLGDGTTAAHLTPVFVANLTDAVAVSAGRNCTCALLKTGQVQCWGANDHGQLGDGTMVDKYTPVGVANLKDAVAVLAGYEHACALLKTGHVQCWGANNGSELGKGLGTDFKVPVDVQF